MPSETKTWFYRTADGRETGPVAASELRARAVAGDILAETPVSADKASWSPAVAVPECGFDCLVLQTRPTLDVLGPFAREYLDRPEVTATLPQDGQFFVRSGTVAEASAVPAAPGGATGAALVERVLAAERALRAAEKRRREAEAALGAKDLEFESERAKFAAEASALKAAVLKRESEAEGLRADVEARDAGEREALAAQARLVDAEKENAAMEAALRKAREVENALRKSLSEAGEAAAAAEARAEEAERRAAEAESRAAGTAAWLRETLSKAISEAEERLRGAPVEAVVEPEVVRAGDQARQPRRQPDTQSAGQQEPSRSSRMAALESQLRKELRMAGAASAPAQLQKLFKAKK